MAVRVKPYRVSLLLFIWWRREKWHILNHYRIIEASKDAIAFRMTMMMMAIDSKTSDNKRQPPSEDVKDEKVEWHSKRMWRWEEEEEKEEIRTNAYQWHRFPGALPKAFEDIAVVVVVAVTIIVVIIVVVVVVVVIIFITTFVCYVDFYWNCVVFLALQVPGVLRHCRRCIVASPMVAYLRRWCRFQCSFDACIITQPSGWSSLASPWVFSRRAKLIVRVSKDDLWIIHGRYISLGLVSVGVKLPVGILYRLQLFSHSNEGDVNDKTHIVGPPMTAVTTMATKRPGLWAWAWKGLWEKKGKKHRNLNFDINISSAFMSSYNSKVEQCKFESWFTSLEGPPYYTTQSNSPFGVHLDNWW